MYGEYKASSFSIFTDDFNIQCLLINFVKKKTPVVSGNEREI